MRYSGMLGLAYVLLLCGCGSEERTIGNESDGFPLHLGAVKDFEFSFPVRIIDSSKDLDIQTTMDVKSETQSSEMCVDVPGCAFVKKTSVRVEEAGNFLTGSFAGADSTVTDYFRSDGSKIRSVSSDGVICSIDRPVAVRGQVGSTYASDQQNCSDGNNFPGVIKVFRYNSDFVEVTEELNGGQVRTTTLLDRQGNVKGIAVFQMELGITLQGSSYNVQNPTIN
jgi:hypothetical protein